MLATSLWRCCLALLLSSETAHCNSSWGTVEVTLATCLQPGVQSALQPVNVIKSCWPWQCCHMSKQMLLGQLMQQGATLLTCCINPALPCTCAREHIVRPLARSGYLCSKISEA